MNCKIPRCVREAVWREDINAWLCGKHYRDSSPDNGATILTSSF